MSVDIFAESSTDNISEQPHRTDPTSNSPSATPGRSWIAPVLVAVLVYVLMSDRTSPRPPSPIDEEGFRVLVVEETEKRSELTPGQLQSLLSVNVRRWLDENCAKDNGQPARLIVDSDTDVRSYGPSWQSMREQAKRPFPCIVISHPPGLTVRSIGRDFNPDRMIELLQQTKGGSR